MAITLRVNWGSFPVVERVFAADPEAETALVLLSYQGEDRALAQVEYAQLEALDESRTFTDVAAEVQKRAQYLLKRED